MTGRFKRLFFDIEVSPNITFSWNIGHQVSLSYESIIQERAVICICYKYEGESKVHSLTWNNGDDKEMLAKFAEIVNDADEVIGHNSDKFDIKWIRTRCLYHGISMSHKLVSIDTLKEARARFKFNSNRLDYIAKYLGIPGKLSTGYDLWKNIVLHNDAKSLAKMVKYCKNDVKILEQVYQKLVPYIPHKTHKALFFGKHAVNCPECSSDDTVINKHRITASGIKHIGMQCKSCGKYFSVTEAKYDQAVAAMMAESEQSENE